MAENNSRQGGSSSWKQGILKRPLPEICVFAMMPSNLLAPPAPTAGLWLRGLNPNLTVRIAVALSGTGQRDRPVYPALPGTANITPYTMTTSGQVLFQRPLTLAPQTLPATAVLGPGYRQGDDAANPDYGASGADGALIEVSIDPTQYATLGTTANLLVTVTGDYTGHWWDVEAIVKLLGALEISSADPIVISTGGL